MKNGMEKDYDEKGNVKYDLINGINTIKEKFGKEKNIIKMVN